MTGCEEALRAAVEAWGGGPLPAEVAAHLSSCASCARELERTVRLLDDVAAAPAPDPGEAYWASFAGRVMERLPREEPRPAARPWLPFLRVALPAAAALVLAAGVAFLMWARAGGTAGAPGLDTLEARMDEALEAAPGDGSDVLEDLALLPTGAGDQDDELGATDPVSDADPWTSEEAITQADDLAAVISGDAGSGWPDWGSVDRLVDGLSGEQAREMIEELTPESAEPSPAGA